MPYEETRRQAEEFWNRPNGDYVSVAVAACALGINRNSMPKIPVAKHRCLGRLWYRKGELLAWATKDRVAPESLWRKLQAESQASAQTGRGFKHELRGRADRP